MKTIIWIIVANSILMGVVYAGAPATDSCVWPTIPSGLCIPDESAPGTERT